MGRKPGYVRPRNISLTDREFDKVKEVAEQLSALAGRRVPPFEVVRDLIHERWPETAGVPTPPVAAPAKKKGPGKRTRSSNDLALSA
jgi:hypothetical protein